MSEFKNASGAHLAVKSVAGVALALLLSACSMGSMFGRVPARHDGQHRRPRQCADPAGPDRPERSGHGAGHCHRMPADQGPERRRGDLFVQEQQDRRCPLAAVPGRDRQAVALLRCLRTALITVDMGVVGRVLLGPAGEDKEYTIPVRFAVERDDLAVSRRNTICRSTVKQRRTRARNSSRSSIMSQIPFVGGENIVIWVGFDTQGLITNLSNSRESAPARAIDAPRLIAQSCARGRDRPCSDAGPAPKEQPPRKLSGKRTASILNSGKRTSVWASHRRSSRPACNTAVPGNLSGFWTEGACGAGICPRPRGPT